MTTKADVYEPIGLLNYSEITLTVALVNGVRQWTVKRKLLVPSTLADVPPLEKEIALPADPAAVPQIEALIQSLVIPVDAAAMHLNVAP